MFLNGGKVNLVSMEQYIVANNKDISAALVFSAQQFSGSSVA